MIFIAHDLFDKVELCDLSYFDIKRKTVTNLTLINHKSQRAKLEYVKISDGVY